MILLEDIEVRERGKKIAIPKGAKLAFISEHGDVLIASFNGIKFSVRKEKVQQ